MTDHLSQSCTGEQGGYESSSYSFVGVSEQGSLADADDVSEHALAQTGVFPDDTLANIEPINSDGKSEVVSQMEAKITALENELEELTSQLVEAKQKQLKLMEKTDAAMERPAQEDYSALKTAKEALEIKFVDIIQQNASIKDENEKLEALVLQLNAETDTIIEYVSLYRDQRSALARKDKERKEELEALAVQRKEVQERVNQLEMLLKSTVQNIRPQVEAAEANRISEKVSEEKETDSDGVSNSPVADADRKSESGEAPEPLELNEMEKGNIDKILSLLDEIRDPLQGQSTPAMIGMEYEGQLMIV